MLGWPLAIVVAMVLIGAVAGARTTPSLHWLLVPAVFYYVGSPNLAFARGRRG